MLGLGRAMGETIAVALVIGASPQIMTNLFAQGEAMPSVIARNLNESERHLPVGADRARRGPVRPDDPHQHLGPRGWCAVDQPPKSGGR